MQIPVQRVPAGKYTVNIDVCTPNGDTTKLAIGAMVYDPVSATTFIWNGTGWLGTHGSNWVLKCVKCNVPTYEHGLPEYNIHPFFADNLQMLEWEYEQAIQK